MPNECYMYDNCLYKSVIFQIKSENISFYATSSFTIQNIIFDGRDFNLNPNIYLHGNPCYVSSVGCCSSDLYNNPTSNSYLSNHTLNRTGNGLTFLQIDTNSTYFLLKSCIFQYFLSQHPANYYTIIITAIPAPPTNGGVGGGGV